MLTGCENVDKAHILGHREKDKSSLWLLLHNVSLSTGPFAGLWQISSDLFHISRLIEIHYR